jgi:hypothetical protein
MVTLELCEERVVLILIIILVLVPPPRSKTDRGRVGGRVESESRGRERRRRGNGPDGGEARLVAAVSSRSKVPAAGTPPPLQDADPLLEVNRVAVGGVGGLVDCFAQSGMCVNGGGDFLIGRLH